MSKGYFQFNGQKIYLNALIKAELDSDLGGKNLMTLTVPGRAEPVAPEEDALLISHFQTSVGHVDPATGAFMRNPDRSFMTFAQIAIHDPAMAAAIQGAGAAPPNAAFVYGNNAATRRQTYDDHCSD